MRENCDESDNVAIANVIRMRVDRQRRAAAKRIGDTKNLTVIGDDPNNALLIALEQALVSDRQNTESALVSDSLIIASGVQSGVTGFFSPAPGLFLSATSVPSAWHRFWMRALMGWRFVPIKPTNRREEG